MIGKITCAWQSCMTSSFIPSESSFTVRRKGSRPTKAWCHRQSDIGQLRPPVSDWNTIGQCAIRLVGQIWRTGDEQYRVQIPSIYRVLELVLFLSSGRKSSTQTVPLAYFFCTVVSMRVNKNQPLILRTYIIVWTSLTWCFSRYGTATFSHQKLVSVWSVLWPLDESDGRLCSLFKHATCVSYVT